MRIRHHNLALFSRTGSLIDEVEQHRAWFELHEGGVYMNQGVSYLVNRLDTLAKTATVHAASLPYYTKLIDR